MLIDENSLFAAVNPGILGGALAVFCLIAFLCARAYRNTNDFKKSVKRYLPLMLFLDGVFFWLGLPVILLLGLDIVGFVALALASNHYFYH